MRRCNAIALLCLICLGSFWGMPAWAGGSGLNVIVVVNQNSTNSVQLGNDYCQLRGVPPQNLLRMTNWTGGSINWSPGRFPNRTAQSAAGHGRQPRFDATGAVRGAVHGHSLPGDRWHQPKQHHLGAVLRVQDQRPTPVPASASCSLPDNSSNSYAYSELPFSQAPPNTAATNSFLAMMLTDTNLAAAENTLCRGVAADYSRPTQTVYLAKTTRHRPQCAVCGI